MVKSIVTEEDAKDALKMGGLPIFFTGIHLALIAAAIKTDGSVPSYFYLIVAAIALLFVILAFRIRSGKYKLYPLFIAPTVLLFISGIITFIAMLFLIFFGHKLDASGKYYLFTSEALIYSSLHVLFAVVNAVLGFQGMRGWLWLKRNNIPMQV